MPRYIDVQKVVSRIPKEELEEPNKCVVHFNEKPTGEENTGVFVFRRKAVNGHPIKNQLRIYFILNKDILTKIEMSFLF